MILDAKLRFLGRESKVDKIAIFEIPPHKRTVLVQKNGVKPYFVQFPYLIFSLLYVKLSNGYVKLRKLYKDTDYSSVCTYLRNSPLKSTKNRVGLFGTYTNVCFGKDVSKYELYSPTVNLSSLFIQISDLYFFTVFSEDYVPMSFPSFQAWQAATKTQATSLIEWEGSYYLDTESSISKTWKFFP